MLVLKDNKPNFKPLFLKYMETYERLEREYYANLYNDYYDDWGDYGDYYDDYNPYYQRLRAEELLDNYHKNFSVGKSNKRGCRGGNKHHKCISLYSSKSSKKRYSDIRNNMFDSRGDDKIIYYYDDIDNPDSATTFYNVYDFDKFLDEEGISVPQSEIDNLLSRSVSHCCINPKTRLSGQLVLLTDKTYGELRWECADANEELIDVKHK